MYQLNNNNQGTPNTSEKTRNENNHLANRGDFYTASGTAIPLLQRTNQIALVLEDPANEQTVRNLIRPGGPLQGFSIVEQYQSNQWILEKSSDQGVNVAQINQSLAAEPGIKFATKVYQPSDGDNWLIATDSIIVSLKNNVNPEQFFGQDPRIVDYRPLLGTPDQYVVTVNQPGNVLAIANNLHSNHQTKWAAPDFYQNWQRFFTPNDPFYSGQWHLNNTGQGGGTFDADVDAPEAWDINPGGNPNIVIGVIDDGMQLNHPDLLTRVNPGEIANNGIDDDGNGWIDDVNGWDFTNNDNDPGPSTYDDMHATAVAGVAAAKGNNNLGVTGMAYKSPVLPARIFEGWMATNDSNIAEAIYYAAGRTANGLGKWNGAQILNNSWGGGWPSTAITEAFTWASNNGVLSFIAAGNWNEGVSYPASLAGSISGVVAVGASTNQDLRSWYSNYGPELDFVAPSNGGTLGILTTDRTGADGYAYDDYTSEFGGTSSATPLAAGIAALILAQKPDLTAAQVRALMRANTDLIGLGYDANGFSLQYGYGRVNAHKALANIGKAEIQVFNQKQELQDNSSVVNFATSLGSSITKTFRVRNQGTENLTLGNINLGSGPFTLVSGFGDNNLGVGESTTFTVKFTPTESTRVNQSISFGNNDLDESPFDFTLSGLTTNSFDFNNPTQINISDSYYSSGPADPYPSAINVAGVSGEIEKVTVTLKGISHTWLGDLDILLVGPTGEHTLLMSDVGDYYGVNGINLTFTPDATNLLPNSEPISSGTYLPTDYDDNWYDDWFEGPAPGGPYVADLGVFNGKDPNGNWQLFVYDDFIWDGGKISGGWSLTLDLSGGSTVQFEAPSYNALEGTQSGTINRTIATLSREGDLSKVSTVPVILGNSGGTATPGVDYSNIFPINVTFAPGQNRRDVVLPIVADSIVELDETINLKLDTPVNANLGTQKTAVFTIIDDDNTPVINGTPGNDVLTGTNREEIINGFAGNDQLNGMGGNDTLNGGDGNDSLNGGTGSDRLDGGAGNDTFVVDSVGDVVVELPNQGTDTVNSSVNYTLPNNVENLTLTGNAAINGTGNTLNNSITGNTANNILNGMGGNDTLNGGLGNDTLIGGVGNDSLNGGVGQDRFRFNSLVEGVDRIADFNVSDDKIEMYASVVGLPPGAVDPSRFVIGAAATNSNQRFIYNRNTGDFFFDRDGNGSQAAVQIASLPAFLNPTSNNIFLL